MLFSFMSEVVFCQFLSKYIPGHTFWKLGLGMGKENQFCMSRLSYYVVKMFKFLEFRTSRHCFWKFHSPWICLNLLKTPHVLILHRNKCTRFGLRLQGFIGPSSVTWSFDTESGIGEANSNEKRHLKKNQKSGTGRNRCLKAAEQFKGG